MLSFYQVNAQNTYFSIGIVVQAEDINTELVSSDRKINSTEYNRTNSEIETLNNSNDYHNFQFGTGISSKISFTDYLNLELQGGLSFLKHETILSNNNELDHTYSNDEPGYFAGMIFSYIYNISDNIQMSISPEIKYINYSEVGYTDPNDDFESYNKINIKTNFLYYNIPILFSYDFSKFKPGIGICYFNQIQNIDYEGIIIDDFNDEFDVSMNYKFYNNLQVAGIAYLDYTLNDYSNLVMKIYITDGIAANLNIQISI
jgi:hypothetical protein